MFRIANKERSHMNDTKDQEDFSSIPNMPSPDEIRESLLATGGPEHWNPFGSDEREPVDFGSLDAKTANRVLEARMVAGPGPRGTPWQHAMWQHHKREADLENEHRRILESLDEVGSYDPESGKGIPAIQSPQKRKALGYRLLSISDELSRLRGESGKAKLERQLSEAVEAEQKRIRNAYIQAEAKRRAKQDALEAEIEAAKSGYRKAGGSS